MKNTQWFCYLSKGISNCHSWSLGTIISNKYQLEILNKKNRTHHVAEMSNSKIYSRWVQSVCSSIAFIFKTIFPVFKQTFLMSCPQSAHHSLPGTIKMLNMLILFQREIKFLFSFNFEQNAHVVDLGRVSVLVLGTVWLCRRGEIQECLPQAKIEMTKY